MERKVNVRRKGPASPRNERLEDEDVFDYPGLEDESSGSGPVSRDAHVALRKGRWWALIPLSYGRLLNYKFISTLN